MVILPAAAVQSVDRPRRHADIPAVSVTAAITLLPALLATLGTLINIVAASCRKPIVDSGPSDDGWLAAGRLRQRRARPVSTVGIGALSARFVFYWLQLNPSEARRRLCPVAATAIVGRGRARGRRDLLE